MSPLVWHTARDDNLIKRLTWAELEFKPDVSILVVGDVLARKRPENSVYTVGEKLGTGQQ